MLIDSHCHIPHRKYEKDTKEIVKECLNEDITKLISIGTSLKENILAINVSKEFKNIYPTIAIYPHEDMNKDTLYLEKELEDTLKENPNVRAIGECGIDISKWEGGRTLEEQIKLFEMQIKLSLKYKLPLIIHNRNGDEYVLKLLTKYKDRGVLGVMHCFDSTWEYAQEILDLGFYISFSGLITYPKRDYLLEVVKNVPMDRFLVETDAPYLPPQTHRGEVNYPKYVKIIAEKVAQVKEKTFNEIALNSYTNTCKLFNI